MLGTFWAAIAFADLLRNAIAVDECDRILEVDHWDRVPENNKRSNLVALCPRCHLTMHQGGRGNVSEGRMGLLEMFENAVDKSSLDI
jgi:predicted HNH restriction endonuclease